MQIPQKRVTKLINHHKVAAFPPQPRVTQHPKTAVKGPNAFSSEVDPVRFRKTRQNMNLELPRQLC
ncbi:MAG: hypothetical protein QHD01_36080 [Bradyrhizobium sp.]|uniref:hypothetical protein n=1 Tax=Bradyrhizobium sp. TaxID=376 RepID=UPI0029B798D1|nr:hypothetical protein [Bradyrhizobium sp.]MDX3971990.1 hypothetical protein [Bradyrhizobium sp.]